MQALSCFVSKGQVKGDVCYASTDWHNFLNTKTVNMYTMQTPEVRDKTLSSTYSKVIIPSHFISSLLIILCERELYGEEMRLTHSRESHSDGSCLAHMLKHLGLAVVRDVMSHLKITKCTCREGRGEYQTITIVHQVPCFSDQALLTVISLFSSTKQENWIQSLSKFLRALV